MRLLGTLALLAACNGFDAPAQRTSEAHPIANAGTGSSYPLGSTVMLDGSSSFDPDGELVSYSWSVVQHPDGSTALPADPSTAVTAFELGQLGTYVLRLTVTDDHHNVDSSDIHIVATGAITSVNAGSDAGVSWLATAQLSGTVTTVPGHPATYSWSFVSRPAGSTATLANSSTLGPTFVADATGAYVVELDAAVGDDVRSDTVTIQATAVSVPLGTGIAAYAYSTNTDRIIYVHDVGHAEAVKLDPMTGAKTTLNVGAFTPTAVSIDETKQWAGVGGPGHVATVALNNFVLTGSRSAPGCTAKRVLMPWPNGDRVDCFPVDGSVEPISVVVMSTGQVTQVACPAQSPDVALTPFGHEYMVDGASPDFYVLDGNATPPLPVIRHVTIAGVAPPVFAAGTNNPFAVTGNGIAVNEGGSVAFDLQMPIAAEAYSTLRGDVAVVSGGDLKIFNVLSSQTLKLSAIVPPVNGMPASTKFLAYSNDEHRLFVVAGNASGDAVFTVAQ